MRQLLIAAFAAALATSALAQDRVTLTNGDVLTGTIKSMADGKLVINSPVLGDVTVPLTEVNDLMTQAQVDLQTKGGQLMKGQRILGIENKSLRLEGDPKPLALDDLGFINPPSKSEPVWTGSLKVGALWTDGNTDRRSVNASFDASRKSEIDRISVDAAWLYSEDKDNQQFQGDGVTPNPGWRSWTLNERRVEAGAKYDYLLSKRAYALANVRALGDTKANLDLRWTIGAGLGYLVIDDGTTLFQVEAGLVYFDERYRNVPITVPETPDSDSYLAARLAYKYVRQLGETTKFTHGVEAFPSLEDQDDFYMQAKTELATTVTGNLIASVAHVLDYDNTPAPDPTRKIERVDNRVLLTIGWTF